MYSARSISNSNALVILTYNKSGAFSGKLKAIPRSPT